MPVRVGCQRDDAGCDRRLAGALEGCAADCYMDENEYVTTGMAATIATLPGKPTERERRAPPRAPRLHERLVRALVRQIVAGELAPGAGLPTEPDLAQQFAVSRTVVREAVRLLVAKGLVSVKQGSGMRVAPPDGWDYLDPLVVFERVRAGGDGSLLDELIEARRALEPEVAALAAARRTPADVDGLAATLKRMEDARDDPAAYGRLDEAFHAAVLAASRNRLLRAALRPVANVISVGLQIAAARPGVIESSLAGHRAISDAIAAGDAAAARAAMRRHLEQFEHDIRTGLGTAAR
jgi:DNA-binding FadR family transcriptional regulator